jgi:hypothetical protein
MSIEDEILGPRVPIRTGGAGLLIGMSRAEIVQKLGNEYELQ